MTLLSSRSVVDISPGLVFEEGWLRRASGLSHMTLHFRTVKAAPPTLLHRLVHLLAHQRNPTFFLAIKVILQILETEINQKAMKTHNLNYKREFYVPCHFLPVNKR
jgi:hypothetical protein